MKRIKQTKIKIKKATNFQKHMHRKEQKKLVHEKIWKFQNFKKIGGGETFSQNVEEKSTDFRRFN